MRHVDARAEAQALVQPGGFGIGCAQAEDIEPPACGLDDASHEPLADPKSATGSPDVQMAPTARAIGRRVRIDVEPADPHDLAADPRPEQDLAGPGEPVRPAPPLVGEAAHEAQSRPLALDEQRSKALA